MDGLAQEDWHASGPSELDELSDEARERTLALSKAVGKPLSPSDPRKHHFIPQLVLRGFATESGRLATVPIDRSRRPFVANIKNTGVVRDFYTTDSDEIGTNVGFEKLIGEIESPAARPFQRLREAVIFPPSDDDRLLLSNMLALQAVRTPKHRRYSEAMADHMWKLHALTLRDEDGEPLVDPDFIASDVELVEHQNRSVLSMFELAWQLIPCFLDRYWCVIKVAEPGLLIADHPIVLHSANQPDYLGIGLQTADEVWMPLDRQTLLIAHWNELVGNQRIVRPNWMSTEDANTMLASAAHEEVYCHPDDVEATKRLRLPKPGRPMANVSGGLGIELQTDGVNRPTKRVRPNRFVPAQEWENR